MTKQELTALEKLYKDALEINQKIEYLKEKEETIHNMTSRCCIELCGYDNHSDNRYRVYWDVPSHAREKLFLYGFGGNC